MSRVPLNAGAYESRSVIASAQRSLNLIPEPLPQGEGEPALVASYPTPGLRLLGTLPQAGIRGIRQCTTGGVYVRADARLTQLAIEEWASVAIAIPPAFQPRSIILA